MYIRGLIPRNSTELAEAGLIDSGNVKVVVHTSTYRERSGSVVECLTRDRWVAGSSLTSVTALCP